MLWYQFSYLWTITLISHLCYPYAELLTCNGFGFVYLICPSLTCACPNTTWTMHFPFEEFFPIFPSSHNKWSVVRDESTRRKLAKWSKKHLLYSYNIKMKNKRRRRSWSANFGPNDKFWKRGRGADKSFCFNKFAVIEGYTNSIK